MFRLISITFFILISMTLPSSARGINLDQLAVDASKQKKHLLVWLHRTDCGYCEAMREFTLEDDAVATVIAQSFLFVHINVNDKDVITHGEFKGDGKAFAKKVGYSFYPSSLFMDENAKIVFAAPGYIEEPDFQMMLKFIKSGAYTKMGYDCFRRQEEKR